MDENENCLHGEDRNAKTLWGKALDEVADDDCDPQRCVSVLRDHTLENYLQCRGRIQKADAEWMEGFLQADGLEIILSAIETLGSMHQVHLSDVMVLVEAVACFRAVANSRLGLGVIMQSTDYITKLFLAFDSQNEVVKIQVLELMSAFCISSEDGLQNCLLALEAFRLKKGYHNRFKPLMIELRSSRETPTLAVALLSFINCVITSHERYDCRCSIRREFLGLDILRVIQNLNDACQDESHDQLDIQCQLFRDEMEEDQEAKDEMEEDEVALHLFNSIYGKIKGTQLVDDFVNILLHLSQLDPENPRDSAAWSISRSLIQQISGSSSAQLQAISRINHIASPPELVTPQERKSVEENASNVEHLLAEERSMSNLSEDMFDHVDGPPPPPPPPGPPPPPPSGGAPSVFGNLYDKFLNFIKQKPSRKMKHVQWSKIPQAEAIGEGTIWNDVLAMKDPVKVDYDIIEKLFCQKTLEKKVTIETSSAVKKSSEIYLLKYDRSLTINIFLKQFKTSPEGVVHLIKNGQGYQFGADRLQSLLKLLPDEAETNLLTDYSDDCSQLGKAEQFLIKLISLPLYKSRIKGLLLMVNLKVTSEELLPNLRVIICAGEALLSNQSLIEFFRFALHAGNFVNAGSYAGNAAGIRVDSLEKIAETKSEEKMWLTLLHYLVQISEEDNPEILQFVHQLPALLKPTERLVLAAMLDEINDLKSEIDKLSELTKAGDAEVKQQFNAFILSSDPVMKELDRTVHEVHSVSKRMVERFCEDETKFIMEDCLKTFSNFFTIVLKCQKDNHERKKREERMRQSATEGKRKDDVDGYLVDKLLQDICNGRNLKRINRMTAEAKSV